MGLFDKKKDQPPKAKADFSNVQSGQSTTAPPPRPTPGVTPPAARTHSVVSGDSLWKIAKKYLGDGNRWRSIYEANREVIGANPDLIKPGQVLTIPDAKSEGSVR